MMYSLTHGDLVNLANCAQARCRQAFSDGNKDATGAGEAFTVATYTDRLARLWSDWLR